MGAGVRYTNGNTDTITAVSTSAAAHTFTAAQLKYTTFLIAPTTAISHVLYLRERESGDTTDAATTDGVIPSAQGVIWERGSEILSVSIYNPGGSSVDVAITPLESAG